jgi:hypothetical protein
MDMFFWHVLCNLLAEKRGLMPGMFFQWTYQPRQITLWLCVPYFFQVVVQTSVPYYTLDHFQCCDNRTRIHFRISARGTDRYELYPYVSVHWVLCRLAAIHFRCGQTISLSKSISLDGAYITAGEDELSRAQSGWICACECDMEARG